MPEFRAYYAKRAAGEVVVNAESLSEAREMVTMNLDGAVEASREASSHGIVYVLFVEAI